MIEVRVFFKLDPVTRLGHGKVDLLEKIEETGSISAAGRALDMSYRRAWELVDQLNKAFGRAVVAGQTGGVGGGGTRLTDLGRDLVAHYRALQQVTESAASFHIEALEALRASAEVQDGLGDGG